ncbi:short-chain fatty acyl-CoA regulator family protein [Sphingomonas sp. ac-8]|uniref:helix-turn-helix domain-containing protein n=1 Tax=Sphingomonas sp. ac-8 TaxID=3242977 RepID=UPI003A808B0F
MAERKLLAGHAVRRLRRQGGLTQAAMAELLGISASYLNLVERNQRPVSAALLVRLAERFDFDPRSLATGEPAGGIDALRRRLADPMFADLEIDRHEVAEWLASAPGGAEAFARAFDRLGGAGAAQAVAADDPQTLVRREVERWRNHFADLDALAEGVADELRLSASDLTAALGERLRVRHHLSVRVLPVEVLPDRLHRLDLHARQLQLSELLSPAQRLHVLARQMGQSEARVPIEALVRGAGFTDRVAERLYRRHLLGYFAAAVTMPYARFLRACEATGYDVSLLARRFGTSLEQVAHRLTTLGRVGARGLAFCLLRIDRAGQVSKRFAGMSGAPMADAAGLCPLWAGFEAFARTDAGVTQLVELEDGSRWFGWAHVVHPAVGEVAGVRARYAVALLLSAEQARGWAAARGVDLGGEAVGIGLGCRACTRRDCGQRSAPPAGHALLVHEREGGVTPFAFAGD